MASISSSDSDKVKKTSSTKSGRRDSESGSQSYVNNGYGHPGSKGGPIIGGKTNTGTAPAQSAVSKYFSNAKATTKPVRLAPDDQATFIAGAKRNQARAEKRIAAMRAQARKQWGDLNGVASVPSANSLYHTKVQA